MKIHSNEMRVSVPFFTKSIPAASHTNLSNTKKDGVYISSQSLQLFNGSKGQQKNFLIENLMKHRESLVEMKQNLTEKTLESGKDISSIQEQLKEFEKQIAELDNKIVKQQMEEQEKALGKEKDVKKNETPQSEEEQLFTQAFALDRTQKMSHVFKGLEREKNTLESEMKLDASRGIYSDRKQEKLIKLEEKLQTIQEQIKENGEQSTKEKNNGFSVSV
ncbi:hypothetical protein [Virgibacillus dokdonensis]|uniref:Uncharacterized protein n=1 Tax=Virgibacillus dokdonensis TaxID=302167 RepID=A0A2K9IW12_9BACI|nr:hypothetical protein [Virgibacillus dokdonensis]AUJ23645.1 hypothetical protein A21D_00532 [Virgibacillus dokdonensis]